MRKRKLFIQITCAILAALLILSLASAVIGSNHAYAATSSDIQAEIDSLSSQKSDIQYRMNEIQSQIDSLDYEKANVLEKKHILDQKNTLAQQELDVSQEQIDIIDGLITNMQSDLEAAREEEAYQQERWLTRVRAMEEDSSLGYVQVVFDATSFSDMLTRIDLMNEVMTYDEELEADYITARENVESLEQEAEELYRQNEVNKAELEVKKAQLESDIDAANELILEMENDIEQYNLVLEQERQTQANVEALIVQKEQELAESGPSGGGGSGAPGGGRGGGSSGGGPSGGSPPGGSPAAGRAAAGCPAADRSAADGGVVRAPDPGGPESGELPLRRERL